ncbi:penicillin-binding transpeptidase domain-containing protein [Nocardiopsis kunsanensis]|uniref:penicillin-binding transpeptidase domain-containing protein n=1 Tax=Nocardiopsis kunsanensis TaxID=141693 RepID=UPI0004784947|nr:penicillin-binding transpeptidase domain-containing protein [Nocardiopsis kunsanensis]
MDERHPRQPDSSEPPEDSADTGAESRPSNPYRIPQRPPENEPGETGGFSYGHPAPQGEGLTAEAWDNPFRSGSAAEAGSGLETPWGTPVPGGGSPVGASPSGSTASEDGWDTGTPWGAPVPDEEPSTSAFGAVGASDETPGPSEGREEPPHVWGTVPESAPGGAGDSDASWDTDLSTPSGAHEEPGPGEGWIPAPEAGDTWTGPASGVSRDTDLSGSGSVAGGTSGTSDTWSAGSGAYSAASAYGEDAAGDAWAPGATGEAGGSWDPDTGSTRGTGPAPASEQRERSETHDTWGTHAFGSSLMSGSAPGGPADAQGPSEGLDASGGAADIWGFGPGGHGVRGPEPTGTGHSWDTGAPEGRGTTDTWGGAPAPEFGTHESWSPGPSHGEDGDAWGRPGPEGPGPDTAAFGPVGHPGAEEYRYGAAHDDGWGTWDDTHSGDQGWDDPYQDQPVHQGDTPYPGGPVRPPASEQYEYLYDSGRDGYGGHGGDDGYGAGPDAAPDPGPGPRRKSRKGLLIGAASAVLVLALAGGAIGWYVWQMPEPQEATTAFAASWEAQDYEALAETTRGDDAAEILGGIDAGLGVDSIDVNVGQPSVESGEGSASYEVTVSLTNADDWGWEGELPLVREDGEWWIDFSPEVAYPGLGEGEVLTRTAVWGERGHILAADGTRLDTPEVSGSLQMIAGSLGEADEDDIERLGPAYEVGDTIGVDGLQRTYEEHLAGDAATTIVTADAEEAQGEGSVEATEENTVATLDGSDGEDITTSIDPNVQSIASSAIMAADDPAGMVAVRPSSGEVLAAVNVPGGFNRAFEGQYPPGSAFKIVSYSALLDNGLSTGATMNCPEEYDLGGWPFRNAGDAEYGAQSVTEAFATSCNTALVSELGDRVSGEQLQASAEQFGMNQPLDIGVTTHEPLFPAVDSATMLGAQGIGQGQILTSPLHMATLPAAIADGSWRRPVLVNDPEPADLPEPTRIANAEAIRPMMRAVVTDGTAESLDFQGEVFGKTGTAEFGTAEDADEDDELPSHAWMVGYKGDVAFAVVVDGGGGGSSVAGPLAESFANGLP